MLLSLRKATWSAPPMTGREGVGVSVGGRVAVGVPESAASVWLGEGRGEGVVEAGATAAGEGEAVAAGKSLSRNRRNPPPARTIMTIRNNSASQASGASRFFLAKTVLASGAACAVAACEAACIVLGGRGFPARIGVSPRRKACMVSSISPAVEKRSLRSLAMAVATIVSIQAGRSGFTFRMCGTGSVTCLMASPMGVSAW